MLQRIKLPLVALAVGSMLVLAWTGIRETAFGAFMAVCTGVLLCAAVVAIAWPAVERLFRNRKGVYDLEELRRVHSKLELKKIDEEHETEGLETVYCPYCGNVYSTKFGVCPNCRR